MEIKTAKMNTLTGELLDVCDILEKCYNGTTLYCNIAMLRPTMQFNLAIYKLTVHHVGYKLGRTKWYAHHVGGMSLNKLQTH